MKIALVRANPRSGGATDFFAGAFLSGAENSGAEIIDMRLSGKNIELCRGCFSCAGNSRCVLKDDMAQILEQLISCDSIAFFTPVYFYAPSAILKIFFERCFPLVSDGGFMLEKHSAAGKSAGALNGKKLFACAVSSGLVGGFSPAVKVFFESVFKALSGGVGQTVLRGESAYFSHSLNAAASSVLDAFKTAGEFFGRGADISGNILENMAKRVSESDEVFAYNAELFWQRLKSGNAGGKKESAATLADLRKIFKTMAAAYKPVRGVQKCVFEFYAEDFRRGFFLDCNCGKCIFEERAQSDASDVAVNADSMSLLDFLHMRRGVLDMLSCGSLKVSGNLALFGKVRRMFFGKD